MMEINNKQILKFGPKTVQDNFRVEIPIPARDLLGHELDKHMLQKKAELVIAQVKRHIDLPGDAPYFSCDDHKICPLCGNEWEVATYADAKLTQNEEVPILKGEPVCCPEAQDAWRATRQETGI